MRSISRRDFLHRMALSGGVLTMGPHHLLATQTWPSSPFLQGNYALVHEEITVEVLEVVGALPQELHGMFVCNGPNPQFPPLGNYHWFDGDGMLHGVRIAAGKASYRHRYVRTAGWQLEQQAGAALWGGFNAPPPVPAPRPVHPASKIPATPPWSSITRSCWRYGKAAIRTRSDSPISARWVNTPSMVLCSTTSRRTRKSIRTPEKCSASVTA